MSFSSPHIEHLFNAAKAAQANSHSPYSHFKVGAALIADDGQIYAGCNVENAAYPLCQCAEATAIGLMVVSGAKHIRDILVLGPEDEFCPPCGGCRQKINEFAQPDTQVHLATLQGEVKTMTLEALLPLAF